MTLRARPDFRPVVVRRSAPHPRWLDDVPQEPAATESVEPTMDAPGGVDEPGRRSFRRPMNTTCTTLSATTTHDALLSLTTPPHP